MIRIVSMKIVCFLEQPLDLLTLSTKLDGAILPKNIGSWVKYRMAPENYFIEFYKNRKFFVTGVKTLNDVDNAAQQVLKLLKAVDLHSNIAQIEIVNMVCLGTMKLNFTLEEIVYRLNTKDVSYEPEQFPGLILKKWGASFLIFSTGKVIVNGVKDFNNAKNLFKELEKLVNF